jgi:hypothetical protein
MKLSLTSRTNRVCKRLARKCTQERQDGSILLSHKVDNQKNGRQTVMFQKEDSSIRYRGIMEAQNHSCTSISAAKKTQELYWLLLTLTLEIAELNRADQRNRSQPFLGEVQQNVRESVTVVLMQLHGCTSG